MFKEWKCLIVWFVKETYRNYIFAWSNTNLECLGYQYFAAKLDVLLSDIFVSFRLPYHSHQCHPHYHFPRPQTHYHYYQESPIAVFRLVKTMYSRQNTGFAESSLKELATLPCIARLRYRGSRPKNLDFVHFDVCCSPIFLLLKIGSCVSQLSKIFILHALTCRPY